MPVEHACYYVYHPSESLHGCRGHDMLMQLASNISDRLSATTFRRGDSLWKYHTELAEQVRTAHTHVKTWASPAGQLSQTVRIRMTWHLKSLPAPRAQCLQTAKYPAQARRR